MYLAHLEKLLRTRLSDVLVEEGLLERSRVEEALADQDDTGKQLGELLVEQEVLTDYDLAKIVTTHYSLPYLDLAGYQVRRELMELLPPEFCARYAVLPLDQFGSMLTLAVAEMPSSQVIDEIVKATQLTPILFVATRRGMLGVIDEEKKRLAGRPTKAAAKPAPAAQAQQASPPHLTAAPSPVAVAAEAPDEDAVPGGELPDFDLPTVPLKLAGSMARNKPGAAPAPKPAPAGNKKTPAAALRWMDAAAKSDTPKPADAAKPGETPKPNVSKYGGAAAAAPRPAPAPAPAPVAKPAAPAPKPAGDASWQAMFDVADEAVKKVKPK
jgi:Type II secretion system (T2SS), protein E, N-terminal domain